MPVISGQRLAEAIDWISDTLDPEMRGSFLDAVDATEPQIRLLIEALRHDGNPFSPQVERAIGNVGISTDTLLVKMRDAYAAGSATASTLAGFKFNLRFDMESPRATAWAESSSARLVKYVNAPTRAVIRNLVHTAFRDKWTVDALAAYIQNNHIVGLLPQHAVAVGKYRTALAASNISLAKAAQMTSRYSSRLLRYRAWNIARTEIVFSSNAGVLSHWQSAVDAGFLDPSETRRVWHTRLDERACSICRGLDLKQTTLTDDFYGDTGLAVLAPPAHPSCRCAMGLVFTSNPGMQPLTEDSGDTTRYIAEEGGLRAIQQGVLAGLMSYKTISTAARSVLSLEDLLYNLGVVDASIATQQAAVLGFLAASPDLVDVGLLMRLRSFAGADSQ